MEGEPDIFYSFLTFADLSPSCSFLCSSILCGSWLRVLAISITYHLLGSVQPSLVCKARSRARPAFPLPSVSQPRSEA